MIVIQSHELREDLERYLAEVEKGQTLVVTRNQATLPPPLQPRPIGLAAGQFIVPDDFDAPLPEDILDEFKRATLQQNKPA